MSLSFTRQDADTDIPVSQHLKRLFARVTAPVVVGGVNAAGQLPPEDENIRKRLEHVLLYLPGGPNGVRKETLLEFYARVGLGPAQIMTMDKEAISQFVWRAELNNQGPDAVRAPRLRQQFAVAQ